MKSVKKFRNILLSIRLVVVVLTLVILIFKNEQYISALVILLIFSLLGETLYKYLLKKKLAAEELRKVVISENSKTHTIFWSTVLIFWISFGLIYKFDNIPLYAVNIYTCFMWLFFEYSALVLYNDKGILYNGWFQKFIYFKSITEVSYEHDRIIIETLNGTFKYAKSRLKNEQIMIILNEHLGNDRKN